MLAVNTPMFNRNGSVGRLLPGDRAAASSTSPASRNGGRLLVRGPNIMAGYYRADNPGEIEPPPLGWHDTGDIVAIDRDGFVWIKGRAKRFANIAGEMVSLAAVEEHGPRPVARQSAGRRRRARPQEGRADRHGDDQARRDPRRGPGLDEGQGRGRVSWRRRWCSCSRRCRCSARARPTTSNWRRSCATGWR